MFLTVLAWSAIVQPDRWVQVGDSSKAPNEYLDKESVRRSGNKVTAWTRRDYMPDQGTAWHELEFDCASRTETILAYVRDDRGIISHNVVRPHRGPTPIQPGSAEDRIFQIVCR